MFGPAILCVTRMEAEGAVWRHIEKLEKISIECSCLYVVGSLKS